MLPYRTGSRSSRALVEALGGKRLRLTNSKYKYRDGDLFINWGNSSSGEFVDKMTRHMEYPDSAVALNWHSVERVTNKLQFFNNHKGSAWLPEFWTNKDEIPEEAFEHGVVCRTVLNGHSGAGIVLAHSRDDLCDAPLYVKYIPKKDEYRVHVGRRNRSAGDGDSEFVVISVQRKARKLEVPDEEVNWKIRNLAGGFIFARNNVKIKTIKRSIKK